jgi:cyclic dehypoxanthinyl futalosine synthase
MLGEKATGIRGKESKEACKMTAVTALTALAGRTERDPMILPILRKALDGERLTFEDIVALLKSPDLLSIGMAANEIRFRLHPEPIVTYVVSRNINYTNVCVDYCSFCAFYRPPGHKEGYVLPLEVILQKVQEAVELGATQILMQGGLNPELRLDWYCQTFAAIKERFPQIWLHCLSPAEILYIAELEKMSVREVLLKLREAGLGSIPGGGAEILSDRVRYIISRLKCSKDEWLMVMRTAHEIGMRSSATMMFGHVEQPEDIAEHLVAIRDLQDETGGFTAFIHWVFQPGNTPLGKRVKGHQAGGHPYLKLTAIARLALDNFPNIQASWVTQGLKVAQMALFFGANDFGDTVIEENVVRPAGARYWATIDEMLRAIREAGFIPQKRNTMYELLE